MTSDPAYTRYLSPLNNHWERLAARQHLVHERRFLNHGVRTYPPFGIDQIPLEVRGLWDRVQVQRHHFARLDIQLPDDLLTFLNDINASYETLEAVELYYRRILGGDRDTHAVQEMVQELGATGDLAIRLEVLLLRHAQSADSVLPPVDTNQSL